MAVLLSRIILRERKVKQMGEKIKSIGHIISVILFVMIFSIKAYGADFNGSVSSSEVTQGDEVTVTVKFTSDTVIGAYDMKVEYDAGVLEYISGADGGGGGSLQIISEIVNSNSDTRTIKFKAKGVGTTAVNVIKFGDVCDMNGDDLQVKVSGGTVKVNAPVIASSNNYLASLEVSAVFENGGTNGVTLSPSFSKDVTEYNLSLGEGASKLVVSAAAEDGKSTVTVGGTKLVPGANIATIEVKAENGSVRVYYIHVNVKEPETTTPEPTTSEPVTDGPSTEKPSTEEPPTDTPSDDKRKVTISGKEYIVTDITEETALPEGFEKSVITWNGLEIAGAADISKTLSLIYTLNKETGEYTFFIYKAKDNSYQPFLTYSITQRSYIMLNTEDDLMYNNIPAYESSELELVSMMIGNGYVDAYKLKNMPNIYIVRAMNWYNKIYYYYYNSDDGSMLPYFQTAGDGVSNEQIEAVQNVIGEEHEAYEKRIMKRNVVIFVLGTVTAIALAACAYMIIRTKYPRKESDISDDDYDEYEEYEEYGNQEETATDEDENAAAEEETEAEAVEEAAEETAAEMAEEIMPEATESIEDVKEEGEEESIEIRL